jgi:general secretion pathway protein D
MNRWRLLAVLPLLAAAGCERKFIEAQPPLEPLPPAGAQEGIAAPRVNGPVGTAAGTPAALTSTAAFETLRQPPPGTSPSLGPITLDFADTDIREVATQILGGILHVNFTIDPAVKGTATLHTATPMTRDQLVATLQSLLAANNATLIQTAGFYRVVPATGGAGVLGAGGSGEPVPLRYASAVELAKVLQPFLQAGGRIAADPGSNSLIVVGDPATREALIGLIRAFDVDTLAGQSYALFPVSGGDVAGTVAALQVAFRSQGGGALANLVRVVPMQAINSVLVIANQPSYIEDARRVFTLVERDDGRACEPGTSITSRTAAATMSPTCCSRPSRLAASPRFPHRPAVLSLGPRPAGSAEAAWAAAVAGWAAVGAWVAVAVWADAARRAAVSGVAVA